MKKTVELRNEIKKKKPDFLRQDSHKKPKLGEKWRKPKGSQSKIRLSKRGYRRMPSQGYRSPIEARGLDRDGLLCVRVVSNTELEALDTKIHKALLPSTLGRKKTIELLKIIIAKNIPVKNFKDPKKKLEAFEAEIAKKQEKKKAEKETAKKAEEKKKIEEKKKADEKKAKEAAKKELTEEEKKDKEKKEKDKVLIKKE
ncbi:hypothetical protein K9M79_02650 [Candidatus Woesearchaeota archaeon]|nr:hypothetical protein [Candidatus Woesearchaeota archaeon]